jgi:hypothetical protein
VLQRLVSSNSIQRDFLTKRGGSKSAALEHRLTPLTAVSVCSLSTVKMFLKGI